jgi:hypothetical protein
MTIWNAPPATKAPAAPCRRARPLAMPNAEAGGSAAGCERAGEITPQLLTEWSS